MLFCIPVDGLNKSVCILHLLLPLPMILNHFDHTASEVVSLAASEKFDGGIVKIELIYHGIGYHHRNAHRHKFKDLGAKSLVAKIIFALWNDPEIGSFHNLRDFTQRSSRGHFYLSFHAELLHQL